MLPDALIELFDATDEMKDPARRERQTRIASLVHANQVQSMTMRTAFSRFAHANRLNLIDFQVVHSIVALGDAEQTATPGLICQQLSLSASTLTSILERLVNRGLLLRERDSADRRRISVYYTAESANLIMRFYQFLADAYDHSFGHLGDEELDSRAAFLDELTASNELLADTLQTSDDTTVISTEPGRASA